MEASGVLTDPVAETQTIEQPVDPSPAPVESPPAPFPSQEAPVANPERVEAVPEPVPAVVEPDPCSITLITGQRHDVADRATLIKEIDGTAADGSSPWIALERPGLSNLAVRASAIIAYE